MPSGDHHVQKIQRQSGAGFSVPTCMGVMARQVDIGRMPMNGMSTDIRISTHHADENATEFWLRTVDQLLINVECGGHRQTGLNATLLHKDFHLFRAASIVANEHSVTRTAEAIRTDGRDPLFVCLMKRGKGFTYQGVDCVHHVPGDIVLYDTAYPYGHGFPGDMEMCVLDIPRSVFEQVLGPWQYKKLIKIDHGDGIVGWCAQAIHRAFDSEEFSREQRATQVLELLSTALRVQNDELATTRSSLASLWRAKNYIVQHLADDEINCESISRAVGLSTRQLSRLFELDGTSVNRHIWTLRLERCRIDLKNQALRHLAVSDVAFRWGFNHVAHFSRSYRNRFGETPSMTRKISS